jgi:hypothetical protein
VGMVARSMKDMSINYKRDEPREGKCVSRRLILEGDTYHGVVAIPQSGMGFMGRVRLRHPVLCLII